MLGVLREARSTTARLVLLEYRRKNRRYPIRPSYKMSVAEAISLEVPKRRVHLAKVTIAAAATHSHFTVKLAFG